MILRPDEYGHQNSNNAFVDSLNVRGGRRVVADLTELYLLCNLQDKLKDNVTIVRVLSEDIDYVLVDKTKANLAEGWKVNSSITEEKEIVVSDTTPLDPKNKLWISGVPGVPSPSLTIDWANVNNKPLWINPNHILKHETVTNNIVFNEFASIYKCDISTAAIFTLGLSSNLISLLTNSVLTVELHINLTTVSTLTFPVNVTWIGTAPTFDAIKKYAVVLRTMDVGTTWITNLAYTY